MLREGEKGQEKKKNKIKTKGLKNGKGKYVYDKTKYTIPVTTATTYVLPSLRQHSFTRGHVGDTVT